LKSQRLADWADHGQALKTNVEAAGARREGLRVPVTVAVTITNTLTTFPRPTETWLP